jgi:phosphatidylinositol 4-kinase
MDHEMAVAKRSLQPHLLLTTVISSRFQAVKYRRPGIMGSMFRLLARSFQAHKQMRRVGSQRIALSLALIENARFALTSTHPLAREVRFSLVLFALQVLASSRVETLLEASFRDLIYAATLSWFAVRPM